MEYLCFQQTKCAYLYYKLHCVPIQHPLHLDLFFSFSLHVNSYLPPLCELLSPSLVILDLHCHRSRIYQCFLLVMMMALVIMHDAYLSSYLCSLASAGLSDCMTYHIVVYKARGEYSFSRFFDIEINTS